MKPVGGTAGLTTKQMLISYKVTNEGNLRLTADSTLQVEGLFGRDLFKAEKPLPEILPGQSTTIQEVWDSPPLFDRAVATVTATAEGDVETSADAVRWIIPWLLVLAIGPHPGGDRLLALVEAPPGAARRGGRRLWRPASPARPRQGIADRWVCDGRPLARTGARPRGVRQRAGRDPGRTCACRGPRGGHRGGRPAAVRPARAPSSQVRGQNWPPKVLINVVLCGNNFLNGASDCAPDVRQHHHRERRRSVLHRDPGRRFRPSPARASSTCRPPRRRSPSTSPSR